MDLKNKLSIISIRECDDNFPFSDKVNSVLKGKQKIKSLFSVVVAAVCLCALMVSTVHYYSQTTGKP